MVYKKKQADGIKQRVTIGNIKWVQVKQNIGEIIQRRSFLISHHYTIGNIIMFFLLWINVTATAWKVSKYGVFSGPYFPIFGLNTEIYGVNSHSVPFVFSSFNISQCVHENNLKPILEKDKWLLSFWQPFWVSWKSIITLPGFKVAILSLHKMYNYHYR